MTPEQLCHLAIAALVGIGLMLSTCYACNRGDSYDDNYSPRYGPIFRHVRGEAAGCTRNGKPVTGRELQECQNSVADSEVDALVNILCNQRTADLRGFLDCVRRTTAHVMRCESKRVADSVTMFQAQAQAEAQGHPLDIEPPPNFMKDFDPHCAVGISADADDVPDEPGVNEPPLPRASARPSHSLDERHQSDK